MANSDLFHSFQMKIALDFAVHFQAQPRRLASQLLECSNVDQPSPCQDSGIWSLASLARALVLSVRPIRHEYGVSVAVKPLTETVGLPLKRSKGILKLTSVEVGSAALEERPRAPRHLMCPARTACQTLVPKSQHAPEHVKSVRTKAGHRS
jgi:hypothetical protein